MRSLPLRTPAPPTRPMPSLRLSMDLSSTTLILPLLSLATSRLRATLSSDLLSPSSTSTGPTLTSMATGTNSSSSSTSRERLSSRQLTLHGSPGLSPESSLFRMQLLEPPPVQKASRLSWPPLSESGRPMLLPPELMLLEQSEPREKPSRDLSRKPHEPSLRSRSTRDSSSRLLRIHTRQRPSLPRSTLRTRSSSRPSRNSGLPSPLKPRELRIGSTPSSMESPMALLPLRTQSALPSLMP